MSRDKQSTLSAALQDKWMRELRLIVPNVHRKNKITLAMKMGLEAKPKPELSKKEWNIMYKTFLDRNDIQYGCAICQDHFKNKKQVLLSCSHSFHSQCIYSFESYSQTLCCPICRTNNYKKKEIYDGKIYWQHYNVTIIQKYWYYFKTQKEYQSKLKKIDINKLSPNKKSNIYLKKCYLINKELINVYFFYILCYKQK